MTAVVAGRRWAYLGATLGGLVSIAANIAHSYVPPTGVDSGWSPKPGAVLGAVFWPVALFVATEILTRVAWPAGRVWWLLRWAGMLPVGAVAALVSYRHLSGLLAYYGEEPLVCVLGPLAVDGLMVMATGAILATSHHHTNPESLTVPARPDIAVGPAPTPITAASTAGSSVPCAMDPTPEPEPVPAPIPVPSPAVVATRIARADATGPTGSATALRDTARKPRPRPSTTGTSSAPKLAAPATDTPVAAPEPAQPTTPIVSPELLNRARETARQYRTEHGTPITPGQLAVRLKATSEQAAQALAVLGLGPDNPTNPIPTVNGKPVKATR
ncbi:hypothetical protein EV385_2454 [Krasilnikovia cinnamomea]|uniref:DUF2637 domain-containing protein n=1 Tax=Krasilnikovia cinnamomea TaxID=349313 RepID=A0A4V2G706_9ACTN|nr:hypothetical protein [Krasilnikovia cinnamomea]RZU50676.1 hypothetical protein EV385_2454 [Krasilnikovia cinnamomea]